MKKNTPTSTFRFDSASLLYHVRPGHQLLYTFGLGSEAIKKTNHAGERAFIVTQSIKKLNKDDGAPYIHDIFTNNTESTIVETQYCMLAYSEMLKPYSLL